jgi:transcriptional regulator with XRE-family HTH domain
MKFQEMRELQGLSQQQLADRVGTSRSVISRLESNA